MADLEQDVFDAGAAPDAPSPELAPSPQPSLTPPSQDRQDVSSAIDALRGPVPNYGSQPQPQAPPKAPPNPDDEPVRAGGLRDLLNERAERQRLEATLRDIQAREKERERQAQQPKTEDLIFSDPEAFKRNLTQEFEQKISQVRLESDMHLASMRHGQLFDAAWQHFYQSCQNGADPVSYFRVMNARSPGEEMVRWFNERRVMHETGGSVEAYRMRVAQQLLSDPEFMAHVQAQAGVPQAAPNGNGRARGDDGRFVAQEQQQPRQEVRLPTSLSRMSGARGGVSPEIEDGSEEAIFDAGRPRSH